MKKQFLPTNTVFTSILTKVKTLKLIWSEKMAETAPLIYLGSIFILSMCCSSCAPVFSEMQSARTVGQNKIEVTPSLSAVNFREKEDVELIQNHAGVQLAYGLTPKIDLRLRFEYIWFDFDDLSDGISVLGIGPKFSLIENKIALYLPVGKVIGKYSADYDCESHPTLLFTIPALKDKIDINLSPKYLMIFGDEYFDYMAFNFGFSLSNNLNKWCLRPEYGILINPDITGNGHYTHLSLGFSYVFGK